jgi:hypothetical protein
MPRRVCIYVQGLAQDGLCRGIVPEIDVLYADIMNQVRQNGRVTIRLGLERLYGFSKEALRRVIACGV